VTLASRGTRDDFSIHFIGAYFVNERVDCVFTCEVRGGAVRSGGELWAGWRAGSLTPGSIKIDKQTIRQIDRKMIDK
jgi:hypothetical protein